METISARVLAVAAVAPVAWGTTYVVTGTLLPPDRPLLAAALRALPAGLLLLAWRRRLPRGSWWWRAPVLGLCNIGLFFPLLFLSAYHLSGGLASTVQAASPLVVTGVAWLLLRERPAPARVAGALVGLAGVGLLVLRQPGGADPVGLLGAAGSVLVSAVGFVLVKRWTGDHLPDEEKVDLLTLVSWQLVVAGLLLAPLALAVEGPPPPLDPGAVLGFLWLGGVGTVLAYACWFRSLQRLPAAAVALVGLLNPVVGTLLGVLVLAEVFGPAQALGAALVLAGVLVGVARPRTPHAQPTVTLTSLEETPVSLSVTRKRLTPWKLVWTYVAKVSLLTTAVTGKSCQEPPENFSTCSTAPSPPG